MKDLLHIASMLDNSGKFVLSDKLFKIAQQGRLNLDKQTGIEDFREQIKSIINASLVKNKLNPLEFVIDFKKLNELAQENKLLKNVKFIADVREFNEREKETLKKRGWGPVKGLYNLETKEMFLPKKFNSNSYTTIMHEIVHSLDPILHDDNLYPALEKQLLKGNMVTEWVANFENLDNIYSPEKMNKIYEIFYLKDRKKYPTDDIAKKAFLSDLKSYMQNPTESILFSPSKFESYVVAVNDGYNKATEMISDSFDDLPKNVVRNLYNKENKYTTEQKNQFIHDYKKKWRVRENPRNKKYYSQLLKFFTNRYLEVQNQFMQSSNMPVTGKKNDWDINKNIVDNWLFEQLKKRYKIDQNKVQTGYAKFILFRRDLYNKFISTLKTLNIVLDESFNFQDPRWQLLEPIVELLLNEFIKYLENPQNYKTNLITDEQKTTKQLNEEITKIINDKTIKDKKAYFLKYWGDSLKKLGTLEQNELLSKFPVMSLDQGLQIMKNIGQK
jgi:hypothetical protein